MLLSGLLAGLGGAGEALGLQGRYYNVALGLGFEDGLEVVLLRDGDHVGDYTG